MSSSSRVFSKIRSGSKSSEFIEKLIESANHGEVKKVSRLSDFRKLGMKLQKSCHDCGWKEDVDLDAAEEKFGEDAELKSLKYTCGDCGSACVSTLPV